MAVVPVGSFVFFGNGGVTPTWTSADGVTLANPPSVAPGVAAGFVRGGVQLPSGAWGTRSQNNDPPYYSFETWDVNWSPTGGWPSGFFTSGLSTNFVDAWYTVANGPSSTYRIAKLNASGVVASYYITGQFAFLSGVNQASVAVNQAESIAYYGTNSGGTTGVKRWNLGSDAAMSDLVGVVGSGPTDNAGILVLSDDTIVVGWRDSGVRRYATDGTLLNTYTLDDIGSASYFWLAQSRTPGAFNVSYYGGSALNVRRINASNGTYLKSFSVSLASGPDAPFAEVMVGIGAAPLPLPTPAAPQIACAPQTRVGNGGVGEDPPPCR